VSSRSAQRGVSYLALLLAVAITSGALAAGATLWSQVQRRERETQLLWAGDQIRRAIVAYSQSGADRVSPYPQTLQDLLLDPRSPARRRFLRQIYDDPMTRGTDWGLIRNPQGRIVGVYSRSDARPLKKGRFPAPYDDFELAASYADWRFTAILEPRIEDRLRAAGASAADRAASAVAGNLAPAPGSGASAASAAAPASARNPIAAPVGAESASTPAGVVPPSPRQGSVDDTTEGPAEDPGEADRNGN